MFSPPQSLLERLEGALWQKVDAINYDLKTSRLNLLFEELLESTEPMNIRLKELEQAREEAGKGHPQVRNIAVTDTPPAPGSFAEATAAVIKPAQSAPAATQIASGAKKLHDLTKARMAFNATLDASVAAYAKKLADADTRKAAVFTKANAAVDDEMAGFDSLDTALTEFEGANGAPLSSG